MTQPTGPPSSPTARITLIMPALNEERTLGKVLDELPRRLFSQILVVDNGSTDATAYVSRQMGAEVVSEPRRGYGQACLAGLRALKANTEIVVFMDADGSDVPGEAARLLDPILQGEADLVIGSRERGCAEKRSLTWLQRRGNRFAVTLIRLLFGFSYTDLGPFRAIRRESLQALDMSDAGYGWTVEMQVKAVQRRLRVREVPVSYRVRLGESKISGTLRGTVGAGTKILWTIARLRWTG